MDVQRRLLTKAVQDGQVEVLVGRGISHQHFDRLPDGSESEHAAVYQTMVSYMSKYGTPPSRDAVLSAHPDYRLEAAEDPIEYLIDQFVRHVKRRETQRALFDAADRIDAPDSDMDMLLFEAAQSVVDATPSSSVASKLSEAPNRLASYHRMLKEGRPIGVSLGYPTLDKIILGIQRYELVTIAAPSAWGKSCQLQSISLFTYLEDPSERPLFVSLEMESEALLRRFDAMAMKVRANAIKGFEISTDDEEMRRWEKWAERASKAPNDIMVVDDLYNCVSGDTLVQTRRGLRRADQLIFEDEVEVLTHGGQYRPANWKSYGKQQLYEVEFSNGQMIRATKDHDWVVKRELGGGSSKYEKVKTSDLIGRKVPIQSATAFEYEDTSDYYQGVRNGLIYGDGTIYKSKGTKTGIRSSINQYGDDNCDVLLRFFSNARKANNNRNPQQVKMRAYSMPHEMKYLPDPTKVSPQYARGFIAGYIAADGNCTKTGSMTITTAKDYDIEQIRQVAAAGGIATFGVTELDFQCTFNSKMQKMWRLHFASSAFFIGDEVDKRLILKQSHRKNLQQHRSGRTKKSYSLHLEVVDVRESNVETVFCCEESETNTWVAGCGIVTGNCTVERILAEVMRYKPTSVFVDYVQLMEGPGDNSYIRIGAAIKGLKKIARMMKVPVFTAAQTNRSGFKEGVTEDNIADSIEIFRSSDILLGLERTEELDARNQAILKIVKNRDAAKGHCNINFCWNTMEFGEVSRFQSRNGSGGSKGSPNPIPADNVPSSAIPTPAFVNNPFVQNTLAQ